jgi:hypothetical protein
MMVGCVIFCLACISVKSEPWAGNFFIWDKHSGELLDIHEGDGSVVNVVSLSDFKLYVCIDIS